MWQNYISLANIENCSNEQARIEIIMIVDHHRLSDLLHKFTSLEQANVD